MGKLSAARFYTRALLESFGLLSSEHNPHQSEVAFAEFAIRNSEVAVECGPRTDTVLARLAISLGVKLYLFEASPVFFRILRRRLRRLDRSLATLRVENLGISDSNGILKYYLLNQSFVRNQAFPTLGIAKTVFCVSLDHYFNDIPKPQFIKSDVEGLDIRVFLGAKQILSNLDYFQLEMCSLDKNEYTSLFADFELFVLLDPGHPLHRGDFSAPMVHIEKLGWETVFGSMAKGNTINLCGIRRSRPLPSQLIAQ
jgi:FkbM family methyltransferase